MCVVVLFICVYLRQIEFLISFTEFTVVGKLSSHENLRSSSTISRLADDIPVAHLLRIQIVCSLVIIVIDIPVIPGNVFDGVDREIVHDLLRCLRSTARGESDTLGARVLVEVWRKIGRLLLSEEIGRSQT